MKNELYILKITKYGFFLLDEEIGIMGEGNNSNDDLSNKI